MGERAELVAALAALAGDDLEMIGLPGGEFLMGADDALAYPQDGEGPVRPVSVAGFALSSTTVTVAQFAVFVDATGHLSDAERHGDGLVFAGRLDAAARAGAPAIVGTPWWHQVPGACWWRPEGEGSSIIERADHPVTLVSQRDALAYAAWLGLRLPGEAEWECAARGGLEQQPYPWGAEREPGGRALMKTFVGEFPDAPAEPAGTAAVRSFPANGFGLHEMTGNVWEWTSGVFSHDDPRPVLRGGSHLCHASYCRRYRTSARTPGDADASLGHTGFRVAMDLP